MKSMQVGALNSLSQSSKMASTTAFKGNCEGEQCERKISKKGAAAAVGAGVVSLATLAFFAPKFLHKLDLKELSEKAKFGEKVGNWAKKAVNFVVDKTTDFRSFVTTNAKKIAGKFHKAE